MKPKSQIPGRPALVAIVVLCALPSLCEAIAIIWGVRHGHEGKALRDGLDFWAGGFLALHGEIPLLFDHGAYQAFLSGMYGKLPYHLWSYPPNYLLLAAAFGALAPWHAVLAFDLASLVLLAAVLRVGQKSWWFTAAILASPASLENLLEHQNAALLTALTGGFLLLLPARPRLAGALLGLATIKPQLGLVFPLFLLRRSPLAFLYAAFAALLLAAASLWAFGPAAWQGFIHFTSPAMSNVLLTGRPKEFAGGLVSVFAACRFLGLHPALAIQAAITVACIGFAATQKSPAILLILAALASPYLHDYDLLGASLATALLVEDTARSGQALPGESILFFIAWFGPGLLPWLPRFAHDVPLVLALLLASAVRRGGLASCDSSQLPPGLPASSAGRSPSPVHPESTAPG